MTYKLIPILLFVVSGSALFSQTAEDFYKKGLEQNKLGNESKAIEYFNNSLELDPNYYLSIFEFSKIYRKARSYDLAMTELHKVIKIAPEFSDAYMERGDLYLLFVDYTNACKDFKKAKSLGNIKAQEYLDQQCN